MQNQRPIFSGVKFLAVAAIAFAATCSESPAAPAQANAAVEQRAFLKQYCQTCHNAQLKTGGLALDTIDLGNISHSGETLEKVVRKVWGGSMPPQAVPRPDKAKVDAFLASLRGSLDLYASAHPFAGRPTMLHRLSRTEYLNSVHDLFEVDLTTDDANLLPPDDESYGFDNNGDVLGFPPLLIERYLSMANRVSKAAIGTRVKGDGDVNAYTYSVDYKIDQSNWMEGMPLGTRGGGAFSYHFPADGEYSIQIKLQRRGGSIEGLRANNGGGMGVATGPLPARERVELNLDGQMVGLFLIGQDLTVREPIPPPSVSLLDLPEPPLKTLAATELSNRAFTADDGLQLRLPIKAGNRQISATLLTQYIPLLNQLREPTAAGQGGNQRLMGIGSITITGPYNAAGPGDTLSRRRIFTCYPTKPSEEAPCARTVLTDVARRAFRRPVTQPELQELLTAYERGRKTGDFEAGFQLAFRRILMDPAFLIRFEHDPAGTAPNTPYRLTDLELASRLSFFLWSSIPDDELLSIAQRGQLRQPGVLDRQVRRMLADPRARSLVKNFASEWLGLGVVGGVQPDLVIFSDFAGLNQAFQEETELLLDYVLLGDHNLTELLGGNYTFVNERLARHYGIPDVYGSEFRKVTVADGIRGGLLGQGGILTATSYPNRTSPVLRGQWILNNILGSPAPPPPPNVPRLDEEANAGSLSMRERMAAHRANAVCAGCHARMDPLGLALENFDAVGKWRAGERLSLSDLTLQPIDARGELADGTKFDGVAGLKKALLQHSEEFVYTMADRLFIYALGRGTEWYDAPAIRAAVSASKKDDYRFSTLVLSVVKSTPFQMRMSLGGEKQTSGSTPRTNMVAAR